MTDPIVEQHDDMIALIAFVLVLASSVLAAYVMEQRCGVTQQLLVPM